MEDKKQSVKTLIIWHKVANSNEMQGRNAIQETWEGILRDVANF